MRRWVGGRAGGEGGWCTETCGCCGVAVLTGQAVLAGFRPGSPRVSGWEDGRAATAAHRVATGEGHI